MQIGEEQEIVTIPIRKPETVPAQPATPPVPAVPVPIEPEKVPV